MRVHTQTGHRKEGKLWPSGKLWWHRRLYSDFIENAGSVFWESTLQAAGVFPPGTVPSEAAYNLNVELPQRLELGGRFSR